MVWRWPDSPGFNWSRLRESILQNKLLSIIVFFGVSLRIVFWATLFPIWKHFGTFLIFKLPLLQYLGDFQGYKPSRSPFYDLFSAVLYLPTNSILGIRAVTIFSLLVSVLAVPAMFIVARRLFNHEVAVFATIFYALYPKLLVLTGRGFPEAAATGIVVLSLLALTDSSGAIRGTVSAGVSVTFAYLTYIPAVLFGIYTGLFFIGRPLLPNNLPPVNIGKKAKNTVAFITIPFATGLLYLFFGPVRKLISEASGNFGSATQSLFTDPSAYSTTEKVIRYIGYHFFDFWWHMRGFDKERHIITTTQKIGEFFGDWSTMFFFGWGVVSVALSIPIIIGFSSMLRSRTEPSIYVAGIIILYVIVDTYRNMGWQGGFQFRHILMVFPFLCLCFGVGASQIQKYAISGEEKLSMSLKINQLPFETVQSILQLLSIIAFAVLVTVAFVNIQYTSQNNQLSMIEPTQKLTDEVDSETQIAVTTKGNYFRTFLYSRGNIVPTIWVENESQMETVVSHTVIADIRVVSPVTASNVSEDYLFITEQCGTFSKRQHQLIDATINTGGSQVFNKTITPKNRCNIQYTLIKL